MDTKVSHSPRSSSGKFVLVIALLGAIVGCWYLFGPHLELDRLAEQEASLREFRVQHPLLVYVIAFMVYVAVTGLSLPGATGLSLLYAWYFGFWRALILISFASTSGATVAFLLSRYLFRDALNRRFGNHLAKFNAALDREGAFYLFTLRLIPAVPFFVINAVMGLTRLRVSTFWWVSQIGMLAGTMVYVYAGSNIPSLSQLADPSQLRIDDVKDWSGLVNRLDSDVNIPLRQIVTLEKQTPNLASNGEIELDRTQQIALVQQINEKLSQPDFALHENWAETLHDDDRHSHETRDLKKRTTKMNRSILVATHPDLFSSPKPIIGTNLLLAFVALGLFPLAARKVMNRIRPNSTATKQA